MQTFSSSPEHRKNAGSVNPGLSKPQTFFAPLKVQPKQSETEDTVHAMAANETHWSGNIRGNLSENPNLYHTLNIFGDTQLSYLLRVKNRGYCRLSLETQYVYDTIGEQRAWIALSANHGETLEVINGLPPHSSLHLRLFGERDYTDPNQTWCEGTLEVVLQ